MIDREKQLIEILSSPNWKEILNTEPESEKINLIWSADELAKKGQIQEGLKIIQALQDSPETELDQDYDKKVRQGEDAHIITTVKGSLCWLLKDVLAQFDTSIYEEMFLVLKKLTEDKNLYVRMNSTVPLSILTQNLRAKQKANGDPFVIKANLKGEIRNLAFNMLQANKDFPRVLEYMTNVFNGMRDLSEDEAENLLNIFFYDNNQQLRPEYLLEDAAPLAIYYAEFRKNNFNDSFTDSRFKDFLKNLLVRSAESEGFRSTLIWHFWKTIQENKSTFENLREYIPFFFKPPPILESISQIEFLIEAILDDYPQEAADIFEELLDYIISGLNSRPKNRYLMIYSTQRILNKIKELQPDRLGQIMTKINLAKAGGIDIGD